MNLLVLFFLLLGWIAQTGASEENWGASKGGSLSAEELVRMLRSRGIGKIRLHDADSAMLGALGGEEREFRGPIEVIVGVRNDEIANAGASLARARSWVGRNVVPYVPATHIVGIAVGNEVLTGKEDSFGRESQVMSLVAAMRNIHSAVIEVGLERRIKVSAPQSVRALSEYLSESSPAFPEQPSGRQAIAPLLEFLANSGSYVMLNLRPHDLGLHDAGMEKFSSPLDLSSSVVNGVIDALSVAMESLHPHHHHPLGVVVTGTGRWRAEAADSSSTSSSVVNAGLIDHVGGRVGSSSHPAVAIDAFVDADDLETLPRRTGGSRSSSSGAGAFSSRRLLGNRLLKAPPEMGTPRRRLAPNKSWCVAKSGGATQALQSALDWACGAGGADCSAIQVGRNCFLPNDITAHASYAFNSYYQMKSWAAGSCDFQGLATTTSTDPSSGSCLYTSSTDANGDPSTPTGTTVPSTSISPRLIWDKRGLIVTASILGFLLKRMLSEWKF